MKINIVVLCQIISLSECRKKYDDEQIILAGEVEKLKLELIDLRKSEEDISKWVDKIKNCLSIEKLTREIVVELIDSIEVSEVYEVDEVPQQDIIITYRFDSNFKNNKVNEIVSGNEVSERVTAVA